MPRRPVTARPSAAPSSGDGSARRTPRSRPSTRTDGQQRHGASPRVPAEQVRQRVPRLFTARAMVLSAVLLLAFVLTFPTLHTYLQQRVELRERQADLVAASQRNDDLREQLARWDDPAYLTAQARSRLSYVMPGETAYRIADPETVAGAAEPDEPDSSVVYPDAELPDQVRDPWYLRVWQSVNEAGGVTDTPATSAPGGKAPAPEAPADQTPTTPAPADQEATP